MRALIRSLPTTEYYVDEDGAFEAQRHQGQFNIVDFATGWKVDLIIRKARPFSRTEFERREVADLHGLQVAIATAEDVLLAKLEWAKPGQSPRQIEDIARLLKVRAGELDRQYLADWIRQLGLGAEWEAACRVAGIPADWHRLLANEGAEGDSRAMECGACARHYFCSSAPELER